MHPWADMARFARTGGEANAIAIRMLARPGARPWLSVVITVGTTGTWPRIFRMSLAWRSTSSQD